MPAEMVKCYICHKEYAKSVCTKIRGPHGLVERMCGSCKDRLEPKILKEIRVD